MLNFLEAQNAPPTPTLAAANEATTSKQAAAVEVVPYEPTDHKQLMKFWSTKSPQRDAKFKQIVLAKHIELHDFSAIFENSWGGLETRSFDFPCGEIVAMELLDINLSLHLTLDTNLTAAHVFAHVLYIFYLTNPSTTTVLPPLRSPVAQPPPTLPQYHSTPIYTTHVSNSSV
jgi:hypothetical protein